MAKGDIVIYRQTTSPGGRGSETIFVAPSAGVIQPGEPVFVVNGTSVVVVNSTNSLITISSPFIPGSGTTLLGIAQTASTNTSTAVGTVAFVPANVDTDYLITANVSLNISTQAKYDALVNSRVLMDYTAGKYTMLTTDSLINGFVIVPSDVVKNPGKIAFRVRASITSTQ